LPNLLTLHEWDQGHEAGALDGVRQATFMLSANTRMLWVDDLGLAGSETLKHLYVLVVHIVEVLAAKEALFGH
jgi:hypothetical protein